MSGTMPKILKNFTLFINGDHVGTKIKSITLPKIERKTEEWKAGPMSGPVKVTLGLNAMSMEITAGEENAEALKAWADLSHSGTVFRFASAHSADDSTATQAIGIMARGKLSTIDFGSAGDGLKETKFTLDMTVYQRTVDGVEQMYIDMLNCVERVDGVNITNPILAALGLTTV